MADVVVTVYEANRHAGVNITDNNVAASSGNTYLIPNNGNVRLLVVNSSGSNTLTVATPGSVDGNAVSDLSLSLTASKSYLIGPFPTSVYNNAAGQIAVTVSANADITAIRG